MIPLLQPGNGTALPEKRDPICYQQQICTGISSVNLLQGEVMVMVIFPSIVKGSSPQPRLVVGDTVCTQPIQQQIVERSSQCSGSLFNTQGISFPSLCCSIQLVFQEKCFSLHPMCGLRVPLKLNNYSIEEQFAHRERKTSITIFGPPLSWVSELICSNQKRSVTLPETRAAFLFIRWCSATMQQPEKPTVCSWCWPDLDLTLSLKHKRSGWENRVLYFSS